MYTNIQLKRIITKPHRIYSTYVNRKYNPTLDDNYSKKLVQTTAVENFQLTFFRRALIKKREIRI